MRLMALDTVARSACGLLFVVVAEEFSAVEPFGNADCREDHALSAPLWSSSDIDGRVRILVFGLVVVVDSAASILTTICSNGGTWLLRGREALRLLPGVDRRQPSVQGVTPEAIGTAICQVDAPASSASSGAIMLNHSPRAVPRGDRDARISRN